MKRIRDDDGGGSRSKRRLTSSRGESAGGRRGGSGGDALAYLKDMKDKFQDKSKSNKYKLFLQVMKDFKAQRIDTGDLTARVKELFKGHNHLISGFNAFLPGGYEIMLDEDETAPSEAVDLGKAINLVYKVKKRFENDGNVYRSFMNILSMYEKERKNINEVYNEVASLFEGHEDLLDEFVRFLPEPSVASLSQSAEYDGTSIQLYNERSSPTLLRAHLDKNRQDQVVSHAERNLIVDQPELDDDNAMMKVHKINRRRAEKEIRDRRNGDQDDKEPEYDSRRDLSSHHFPDKRKAPLRIEGFEVDCNISSYEDKDDLKNKYHQGFMFCEKVREKLGNSDDYLAFMKCLYIYSSGEIKKDQLQNLVDDLLGKHPGLVEEFNYFFERCENIDGFLAGGMNINSPVTDGHVSQSIKVEDRDKEEKRDLDGAKDRDKYQGKSIRELDLPSCEDCTPSYRHLPDDYPISSASYRGELGDEVLNDRLVSVTSGTEDYSVKHMRRNQYEESLFLCEDDRFELDMLLELVACAAKRGEEWLDMMNESDIENDTLFNIEGHFTDLHLRCIERIYGDHGLEVMDILSKNPTLALPIILSRLKQKQEEWTKCREDFNKVWAEIYEENYFKSLDHRSFYFKQQDSMNLSARSLVSEIKELKGKQPEDNVLLAYAAGNWQPVVPHMHYEFTDMSIHEDLYKLVQYSCEVLFRKEESNKITRLWTTFLEPMLGIVSHRYATESSALDKKSGPLVMNDSSSSLTENFAELTSVNGTGSISQEPGSFCGPSADNEDSLVINDGACCNLGSERDHKVTNGRERTTGFHAQVTTVQEEADLKLSRVLGAERSHARTNARGAAGAIDIWTLSEVPTGKNTVDTRHIESGNLEDLCCEDNEGENEVEADTEDMERNNVSGNKSAGDECLLDEPEEDEDVEHDDAESEGEAGGMTDCDTSSSERFLHFVKPLSRHVPHGLLDGERKQSWKFFGNDDFFVLFRLHRTLYERILSAKTNSACAKLEGSSSKDAKSLDPYARFMNTLYNLLDGSFDKTMFEDECRTIAGNQSYMLFTLDKLIYKLVKQLQTVATSDVDSALLQLYEYENSHKSGKFIDSLYYDNARFFLHDENIYRFEFECSPSRLSIQLLDSATENPVVALDPNFAAYLNNDFLSMSSGKEPQGVSLQRNKRKFTSLDEHSALSMAMEGVKTFNGLECKISCNSYKMSYVMDTEDIFIRSKKKRGARSSNQDQVQARVQRFDRLL